MPQQQPNIFGERISPDSQIDLSSGTFRAVSVSGTTLYSGSTLLSSIFVPAAQGTLFAAQIATKASLSGASFTGTISSASTDLGNIFVTSGVTIGTTGTAVFAQKRGNRLEFKTLVQGSNVSITSNTTGITISSSAVATNYADSETPAGTIDGVNTVFNLANPYTAGSTHVYLNGLRQRPGGGNDYTESGAQDITFTVAPNPGDIILVDYRY